MACASYVLDCSMGVHQPHYTAPRDSVRMARRGGCCTAEDREEVGGGHSRTGRRQTWEQEGTVQAWIQQLSQIQTLHAGQLGAPFSSNLGHLLRLRRLIEVAAALH